MTIKHHFWLLAFVLASALAIAGESAGNATLVYWTRPFLMPLLGVWFAYDAARQRRFFRNTTLSALGFATFANLMLMFQRGALQKLCALLGVGASIIVHLFYTGLFWDWDGLRQGLLRRQPGWALPVVVYATLLIWWQWPLWLPGLKIPYTAYAVATALMALAVINLSGIVRVSAFRLLLGGAVLFLLLPIISAPYHGQPVTGGRVFTLTAYLAAQLLTVKGISEALPGLPRKGKPPR